MQTFQEIVTGKKVLVFGVGKQGGGQGDLIWLKNHGAAVRVIDKDRSLAPEGEDPAAVEWADLIIKNPGVPDAHPLLARARERQTPILTSIAVFVKYAPLQIIGITGTRGKSTTTALITQLLEKAYPNQVITGGNIPGTSGLGLFDQLKGKKYAVLELSSFQLHNFHDLHVSPHIAVITNLYPDHLNRYPDMAAYQKDKEALVAYQHSSDICIYNSQNPGACAIAQVSGGKCSAFTISDVSDWESALPGMHNRENIAAMWGVGKNLLIPEKLCREVVQNFHGLAFRQEKIREVDEVSFVNDTTATTPTATLKAIAAQSHPTILICGGASKNLPYDTLVKEIAINSLIKHIVFLGSRQIPEFVSAVKQQAEKKILGQVASMEAAVHLAKEVALPGWTILLSPGFASFDLFQNEFDRGRQFNEIVNKL